MTQLYLVINFMSRFVIYGFFFGLGLGFISGVLLSGIFGGILIGLLGVICGILFGGTDGAFLGIITIVLDSDKRRVDNFKFVAFISTILMTFLISWFGFGVVFNLYSVTGRVETWAVLVPSVIATAAAGYASLCIAEWHLANIGNELQ